MQELKFLSQPNGKPPGRDSPDAADGQYVGMTSSGTAGRILGALGVLHRQICDTLQLFFLFVLQFGQ